MQRKSRLSSGASSDDESKRLRGFQHIIQEMSTENAELKDKHQNVLEEVALLKEVRDFYLARVKTDGQEINLLEETSDAADQGEKPAVAIVSLVDRFIQD